MSDVRDKIMAETLWHVDADAEQAGWDQPPQVFAVMIVNMGDGVGAVELKPMHGWARCLDGDVHPRVALARMVQVHQFLPSGAIKESYPPDSLYGLAFVTEAWMLNSPKGVSEQDAKVIEERKLHTLPNRVEIRLIYCVSTTGEVCSLQHERDGIVEAFVPSEDATKEITGEIPDLLAALLKEITK